MMSTLALAMRVSFVLDIFRGEVILPEQSSKNTKSPHEASEDNTAWGISGYRLSITTGSPIRDTKTVDRMKKHISGFLSVFPHNHLTVSLWS